MVNKKRNIIISIILFIFAALALCSLLVPHILKTDNANEGNTFRHEGIVSHTNITDSVFEIYVEGDNRPLTLDIGKSHWKDILRGKEALVSKIESGDKIVYWTFLFDTVQISESDEIKICAFTVNKTKILTIDEFNKRGDAHWTMIRWIGVVIACIFISVGVTLLVFAYKKPKKSDNN